MTDMIEGTWQEVQAAIAKRLLKDDESARIRVTFEKLPENGSQEKLGDRRFKSKDQAVQWLERLRKWSASFPKLAHEVDDSRETIYNEVVRDPR